MYYYINMCKLEEYIKSIKNFKFENIVLEKNETQYSAKVTEKFIEEKTRDFFKDSKLIKAGSQQYPDFILISDEVYEKLIPKDIKDFIISQEKQKKSPLKKIKDWAEETNNCDNIIFIEVKSCKGNQYQCNDSFPTPLYNYVYFMFDRKNEKVVISTSLLMAEREREKSGFDIIKKYEEDKEQIKIWRNEKKEEWRKLGVTSTPRMTYSIKTSYAHAPIECSSLEKIFSKAKLI